MPQSPPPPEQVEKARAMLRALESKNRIPEVRSIHPRRLAHCSEGWLREEAVRQALAEFGPDPTERT